MSVDAGLPVEAVPLIHEAATKPVTNSDVEERLELHCWVVRKGEAADATKEARGGHATVDSCGGEVNGGAGEEGPTLPPHMRSGRSEPGQRRDSGWHFDPDIALVLEEGEQPCREEFSQESPVTKDLVEQGKTLHVQDSMLQKGAATHERLWLQLSLQGELLEEAHGGVFGGHLGRRKTLCRQCRRLCWIGKGQEVEWCCKLYHIGVAEKKSGRHTRAALRWYQFGAPWQRMAVDIAGPLSCTPRDNRYILVSMDHFSK